MIVYRGAPRQYGHGLGSMFKSAFRMVSPIIASTAKSVLPDLKRIAVRQGIGALRDVMSGQKPKQVAKSRAKAALKSIGSTALKRLGGIKKSGPVRRRHSRNRHRRRRTGRTLDVFD